MNIPIYIYPISSISNIFLRRVLLILLAPIIVIVSGILYFFSSNKYSREQRVAISYCGGFFATLSVGFVNTWRGSFDYNNIQNYDYLDEYDDLD